MSTALQLQEMIVLYQGKKVPFSPLLKIGCKLSVHLPVPHDLYIIGAVTKNDHFAQLTQIQ